MTAKNGKNFKSDLEFMQAYSEPVVLRADGKGQVIVAPGLQGRVMTSTADGQASYGWINYDLIKSGERQEHINAFGGEDRFWLAPEGGQFSIFFRKGEPMDLEHWQTPEPIDWGGWDYMTKNSDRIELVKAFSLTNASDTVFKLITRRTIQVLKKADIESMLGLEVAADIDYVGFESVNAISNAGNAMEKEAGLLGVWILGMMQASPQVTIVIPFDSHGDAIEDVVADDYFGKVPAERLKIDADKQVLFFRGDACGRGKIGIGPAHAKDIMGSYSADTSTLTVVMFSLPKNAADLDYMNAKWEIQRQPYAGDVVNSYNDGPTDGEQLGEFYELETTSPSYELAPSQKQIHTHRTFHFTGEKESLDAISQKLFGVGLDEIENALA